MNSKFITSSFAFKGSIITIEYCGGVGDSGEGATTPLIISELDRDVDLGMDPDRIVKSTCVLDFYCSLSQKSLKDES